MSRPLRIGIYPGVFDPVHAGHIGFALQALKQANLDRIYFMPERRPWHKSGVEHFGHRVAMLSRACRPYKAFEVLEVDDIKFTMERTVPKLQQAFTGSQLVYLFGSDVALKLPAWRNVEQLLTSSELVVGVRAGDDPRAVAQCIRSWPSQPLDLHVFESYAADVSSSKVREALRAQRYVHGLLTSVARYSNRNWLYISLADNT
ncbi:MAG TPA: nicotinate-nicotinamide nucleotide adenylyltransferase [Candidatus Saccharimonadales bacterium]|nr:nicotinate-nicotinamide nucleotide adenylyltransferase [Candidatus Saccharimonadales bacterium]